MSRPDAQAPIQQRRLPALSANRAVAKPREIDRDKILQAALGNAQGGEEVKVIGGLWPCLGSVRRTIVRSSISVAESVDVTGPVHARV
jgi:hypothetical protein